MRLNPSGNVRRLGQKSVAIGVLAFASAILQAAEAGQTDSPSAKPSQAAATFPAFDLLANGPQQMRLLPGQSNVVFTMYGAPGELDKMRQVIAVMREQKL